MSLDRLLTQQLDLPTGPLRGLPPAKAALVLEHCTYQLRHRGFLYDFEQVLLLRVAQAITAEPDETHCVQCGEPLSELGTCALCRPRYH